jgi:hypothetical protein
VAEASAEVVVVVVDLHAGGGVTGILVDGVLHLAEEIVDLDEILLCAGIGRHWQIVLLGERVLGGGRTSVSHGSVLRHVLGLRSGGHGSGAAGDGHGAVKGQQRAADLAVGSGVDLAALCAAEEVIHHVEGALAVVATASSSGMVVVAEMLGALVVVHGGLVEVETVVGGRLRRIVAAGVGLVLVLGAHLAVMVVEARGLVHVRPVVHTTLVVLVLGRADEDGVVGMGLDMLLEILGPLE